MESTINRKEYRREYQNLASPLTTRLEGNSRKMKESISISKMMNVMLLFLAVLLLKFFRL